MQFFEETFFLPSTVSTFVIFEYICSIKDLFHIFLTVKAYFLLIHIILPFNPVKVGKLNRSASRNALPRERGVEGCHGMPLKPLPLQ
jgi:hypothetical protein